MTRRRGPMLARMLLVTVLALAAAAALALLLVVQAALSPFSLIRPGTVYPIAPQISTAPEYQRDTGWLALTSVRIQRATYGEWLIARLNPASTIVSESDLRPEGTSERDYVTVRRRWLEGSRLTAMIVALRRAGYPAEVSRRGLVVERVRPDMPAATELRAGDVILTVNGEAVASIGDLAERLRATRVGDLVALELLRNGRRISSTVPTGEAPDEAGRTVLGVRVSPQILDIALPFPLEIKADRVTGGSAGLMMALGVYDALTPGDLAGGRRVAGTGTIGLNGRVGSIGSVAEKVAAAEREQADVFLSPRQNAEAAASAARTLRVVPVSSFDEALSALEALTSQAEDAPP